MRVNRLHRLAVEGSAASRATRWQANGDGARRVGAPVESRGLIDDLIEPDRTEVGELHLQDRVSAFDGCANGHADHRVLTDRCIKYTARELILEVLGRFERTTERADVLSVEEHVRIAAQGFVLRFADGFEVGQTHSSHMPSASSSVESARQLSLKGSGAGSLVA